MVAAKMGGPMPPMGGMPANPAMLNPLSPPMPVPPMGQPMMPPQPIPIQQGAGPVAPQARSNAGRRKRFGDSLESMLASNNRPAGPVASDQMAGMNVFTGQMPRRQMPRGQMMGGTAMQPPVRRMMGGGEVPIPRETDIYGQPHMLAYINPEEADLLQGLGGMGTPGPGGVPQYNWFTDFVNSITGGGSSSSPSYSQPSNDPYSEDRGGSTSTPDPFDRPPTAQDNNPNAGDGGGMETILNDGRSPIGSAASKNANQVYADSMKAGGGGTNLSGSGSSAMADLVAAQQAQTQNDNSSASYFGDITPPDTGGGGSYFDDITPTPPPSRPTPPSSPTYGIPGNTDGGGSYFEDITPPSAPPNTGGGGSYFEDITPPINDVGGGGGSYFEDITTPITGGGDGTDTDTGINLNPTEPPVTYYDSEGNPHSTQAGAAESNRIINQRKADSLAAQEASFAQSALQSYPDELMTEPFNNAKRDASYFGDLGGNQVKEDDSSYFGDLSDPINTGLGREDLLKPKIRPEGGDKDDKEKKGFIDQFKDDAKEFGTSLVNDFQMALDAGLLSSLIGGYPAMRDKLKGIKNPDGTRKYTDAQIDSYINRTKDTQKKQQEKQDSYPSTTEDGTVGGSAPIIDPCPEGMRLDPVAGICVPVDDSDDTEEDTGEEDTSDDELSGVVTTPPPPTSYLDNAPVRAMNRGGSVGLNRAADNFLAAMGG